MIAARAAVRSLAASKIRELFNSGLGRTDILPFWVGEPDEPTPEFIRKAGMDSIAAGVNALMLATQLLVDPGWRLGWLVVHPYSCSAPA
jgi:aspartate/methionine/tyrosine aminotransferase